MKSTTITPRLSKALLTSHITFSLGWFGAIVVFLALAIAGLKSDDEQLVKASLIAMELSAWFVIVPFCIASLLTGIVQATVTKWGLFRHYWIIVKLFLTVASTVLLLLHMQPISELAQMTMQPSFKGAAHSNEVIQLIIKAAAAIVVLLIITTISVYKPWGKIQEHIAEPNKVLTDKTTAKPRRTVSYYLKIGLILLLAIIILKHLIGGGMGHH